eukprot:TRINITY_DN815_c0_g1_i1.p1 TRINITY_DN815_c0_g1~~TRINITY_DN815_c0_g1_i1.p1  ORF type:complete len:292 (+),score=44.70 TRINITY_DN815_c0_g1_i1:53-928(+)
MQKAVVRMYFENGTHKSFLILPKTSVADLIIPVQKKFQTISNYTLYYSVKGSAETALASTDNPWNVWKQHGENVKFTFKKGGSKTPPAVAPRGQRPAPKQATPSYATPSYATPGNAGQSGGYNKPQPTPAVSDAGGLDDFDALLSQLTDMDPSSSSTSSTGGYGLDALDQGSGNSCSACGKPITSKANELFAFGMYWHRDHLACAACKRNFLENNVKLIEGQDGQAYCEPDFLQRFAPKCKKCTHPIQGQVTNALGSQWHPQCFTCWTCDAPFQGTNLVLLYWHIDLCLAI